MLEHVDRVCSRGNLTDDDKDMLQVKELLGKSISQQYKLLQHLARFQNTVDPRGVFDLGGQGRGGTDAGLHRSAQRAGVDAAIPAGPERGHHVRGDAPLVDLAAAVAEHCPGAQEVRRAAGGPTAGAAGGEAASAEHAGRGAGLEAEDVVRRDLGLGRLGRLGELEGGEAVGGGRAAGRGGGGARGVEQAPHGQQGEGGASGAQKLGHGGEHHDRNPAGDRPRDGRGQPRPLPRRLHHEGEAHDRAAARSGREIARGRRAVRGLRAHGVPEAPRAVGRAGR